MWSERTAEGEPPVFENGATSLVTNTILTSFLLTQNSHKPFFRHLAMTHGACASPLAEVLVLLADSGDHLAISHRHSRASLMPGENSKTRSAHFWAEEFATVVSRLSHGTSHSHRRWPDLRINAFTGRNDTNPHEARTFGALLGRTAPAASSKDAMKSDHDASPPDKSTVQALA